MSELAQRPRIGVTPPRQTMTRACQAPQCPMGWRSSPGRTMATRRAGTERGAAIRIRCRGANFVRRRAFCVWDRMIMIQSLGGLIWLWLNSLIWFLMQKGSSPWIEWYVHVCPVCFFFAWLVWCRALGAWHTAIPMTTSSSRRLLKCGGWVPTWLSWCQSDYRVPRDPQNPVVNHGQSSLSLGTNCHLMGIPRYTVYPFFRHSKAMWDCGQRQWSGPKNCSQALVPEAVHHQAQGWKAGWLFRHFDRNLGAACFF